MPLVYRNGKPIYFERALSPLPIFLFLSKMAKGITFFFFAVSFHPLLNDAFLSRCSSLTTSIFLLFGYESNKHFYVCLLMTIS